MGYDIPGSVEDGAWMLWEISSVVAVAAVVAHPGLRGGEALRLWLFPKWNHKHAPGDALLCFDFRKSQSPGAPPPPRVGGGGDDDGRIFPEHPSPILHAPRDIISRKSKSLTPI